MLFKSAALLQYAEGGAFFLLTLKRKRTPGYTGGRKALAKEKTN